jgi:hypothetical protein
VLPFSDVEAVRLQCTEVVCRRRVVSARNAGAALVFSQGINSDWGKTYLVLAALMNAFLLAWAGVLVLDVDRALSAAGLIHVQREIPEEFLRLPLLIIDCSA